MHQAHRHVPNVMTAALDVTTSTLTYISDDTDSVIFKAESDSL